MDENIIIAAYHEAGHALMSYIVGWTISSIELIIENNKLAYAVTNYDFGVDYSTNDNTTLPKRILCLMGGPVSQAIFQNKAQIDLITLEQDGVTINNMLSQFDSVTIEDIIQDSIYITTKILNDKHNINARQQISDHLVENHSINQHKFHQIVNLNNVKQISFV